MFARDDGVWLEYAHSYVVRVLDRAYRPCARKIVAGRLSRDQADPLAERVSMGAQLDGLGGAEIWLSDLSSGRVHGSRELYFAHEVARIVWLDSDWQGRIYVMLHLLEYDPVALSQVVAERNVGVVLDERLSEIAFFETDDVIRQWEQFREFRVTADGTIYQMSFGAEGVDFWAWRWTW
jgi:hypothetical protein